VPGFSKKVGDPFESQTEKREWSVMTKRGGKREEKRNGQKTVKYSIFRGPVRRVKKKEDREM